MVGCNSGFREKAFKTDRQGLHPKIEFRNLLSPCARPARWVLCQSRLREKQYTWGWVAILQAMSRFVPLQHTVRFAVGAVLYQLLFGTYAFVRDSVAETEAATLQGKLPLEPCGEAVGR